MKKVLSLVLALAMVLGSFSFVSAAPMSDVAGTVYEDAVTRLSKLEVLTGYPDGSFKPANTITRAEFAAVAVRVKGLSDAANASKGLATGFNDVTPAHWASGFVGIAGKMGIVNGVGNGLFAPEAPVKYEEAVTMIVRALGYEAAAQAKGAYPYGYLIVANEIGLLDQVKGTQGAPASRGIVAQITDNALEIPMMIQVGFGADVKWVVSGSNEHGTGASEQYLLDSLGFDSVEGRVTKVAKTSLTVTIEDTKEADRLGKRVGNTVKVEVPKDFDTYEVEGLKTKFWYNDDLVISKVQEEAKFDAVEVTKVNTDKEITEIKLITEDEKYDIADGAGAGEELYEFTIDSKDIKSEDFTKGTKYDFVKVVLNKSEEVVWAKGYALDGFILVEEVKDEVAYSFDDYDEIDLEDFTVVKDGKTIGIDGIKENDVLFFNNDEEFAVVYNKGTEGELDRVYVGGKFRLEGSDYEFTKLPTQAIYFDNGKVGELDDDIMDEFLDDEATITVFTDHKGDAVVVTGEVTSVGNSSYAVLTGDAKIYTGRKGQMIALDVRNGANEKVSYDLEIAEMQPSGKDIKISNYDKAILLAGTPSSTYVGTALKKIDKYVLKISTDKDGDVNEIVVLGKIALDEDLEIDKSSVKAESASYRLQSSTVVFHDDNKKATTLANAKGEFKEVKQTNGFIYEEKGRVVAVIGETDADADTKDVTAIVEEVLTLKSGELQFKVKVFGQTQRLITEDKEVDYTKSNNTVDKVNKDYSGLQSFVKKIVTFEVGETSGEIKAIKDTTTNTTTFKIKSIVGRTITSETVTNGVYEAVELNTKAVIYKVNSLDTLDLRELKVGDSITVYFEGSSKRFVDYIVK